MPFPSCIIARMRAISLHGLDPERVIFYGFCGVFFFIPVATSPAIVLGLVTLALWFLSGKFIKDLGSLARKKWLIPVALLVALSWAGLLYTPDLGQGMAFAKKTYYWLYAFAMAGLALTDEKKEVLMKAYLAGLSFTSALFVLQLLGMLPIQDPLTIGLFFSKWAHITLSLLMTSGIVILSFYHRRASGRRDRALCLAMMGLQFAALAFMLTDGGHLAFALLSPVIAYNVFSGRRAVKVLAASAVVVAVLCFSPVVQHRLDQVLVETVAYAEGNIPAQVGGVGGRFYMWSGALRVFAKHPFLGAGTGGYSWEMEKMKPIMEMPKIAHPHSDFLYMGANHGLVGVIALALLYLILFEEGWRKRDTAAGYSNLAITAVLFIGGLTATQMTSTATGMLLALFIGLTGDRGNAGHKAAG